MAAADCCYRPATGTALSSSLSLFLRVVVLSLLFIWGHCLNLGCQQVKIAYKAKGFDENEVPMQAISGEHLEICPQGFTCCTKGMEDTLGSESKREYEKVVQSSIQITQNLFASRTSKFDEFFTELLENSKTDLHEMFVRTYGLIYQQNSEVFVDLFSDLRGYYKGKDVNLLEALDNFFIRLLKRMFQLMNSQYRFTDSYLNCVVEHMNDLQPFGDVPLKLRKQVQRAFVAARTFVQGLAIGRDVIDAVGDIPPTQGCTRALMKMMYCPHCRGLTSTKPCNNLCLNTMKGCLAYHAELNKAWNAYIDALILLADRLEGPFNIESVVDPIDVKISDAIMNFQEHNLEVSKKVFSGCGEPVRGRKKRETDAKTVNTTEVPFTTQDPVTAKPIAKTEASPRRDKDRRSKAMRGGSSATDDFAYGSPWRYKPSNSGNRPITAAGTSLDRLVVDIKKKINTVKDFWVELPYTVCNDEDLAAQPGEEDNCWNGQDKAKYVPSVQQDGVINQVNNPEVDVDVTKANSMIIVQIKQLTLITSKLHNAYRGWEVDWVDVELDSELSGSGSGSGSGMGSSDDGGTESKSTDPYYFIRTDTPTTTKSRPTQQTTTKRYPYRPSSSGTHASLSCIALLLAVVISWLQRHLSH